MWLATCLTLLSDNLFIFSETCTSTRRRNVVSRRSSGSGVPRHSTGGSGRVSVRGRSQDRWVCSAEGSEWERLMCHVGTRWQQDRQIYAGLLQELFGSRMHVRKWCQLPKERETLRDVLRTTYQLPDCSRLHLLSGMSSSVFTASLRPLGGHRKRPKYVFLINRDVHVNQSINQSDFLTWPKQQTATSGTREGIGTLFLPSLVLEVG